MLGVAARTRAVNRRLKSLVELNIELAKLEGKQKATALGMTAGFGIGAAALVFYAIGFGFAAAAAGLNESLLALAFAAHRHGHTPDRRGGPRPPCKAIIGKFSPPLPKAAIEEAEHTLKTLEEHV